MASTHQSPAVAESERLRTPSAAQRGSASRRRHGRRPSGAPQRRGRGRLARTAPRGWLATRGRGCGRSYHGALHGPRHCVSPQQSRDLLRRRAERRYCRRRREPRRGRCATGDGAAGAATRSPHSGRAALQGILRADHSGRNDRRSRSARMRPTRWALAVRIAAGAARLRCYGGERDAAG